MCLSTTQSSSDDPGRDARKRAAQSRRLGMELAGTVRRALHGPKGEVRGALLAGGQIVRLPPHEAGRHIALLQSGASLAVRGEALVTDEGTVIEAKAIGADADALHPIEAKPTLKPTKDKPKGPKPHGPAHPQAGTPP